MVKKDMECGLRFKKIIDYQIGDIIRCTKEESVPQKLNWTPGFWWDRQSVKDTNIVCDAAKVTSIYSRFWSSHLLTGDISLSIQDQRSSQSWSSNSHVRWSSSGGQQASLVKETKVKCVFAISDKCSLFLLLTHSNSCQVLLISSGY